MSCFVRRSDLAVRVEELFHWWRWFRPWRITSVWDTQASTCDWMFPLRSFYLNFSCAVFCVAAIQRATWQVHLHRAVTRHAVLFTSLPPFFLCFPDLLFLKEHHSFSSSSCFLLFPPNKDKPVRETQLKLETYEGFLGVKNPEGEGWTVLLVSPLNRSIYCFAFFLSAEEKGGRGVCNLSEISGQPWSTDVYLFPSNLFKLPAQCAVCVALLLVISFLYTSELLSCLKESLNVSISKLLPRVIYASESFKCTGLQLTNS